MTKIRVVIADDHPLLLRGIRTLIDAQPDMEVVGEARNIEETLQVCRKKSPHVLTLDLTMPHGGGIGIVRRVCEEFPGTRTLIVSMHNDPAYFHAAMAFGAGGYVVKTATDSELVQAIRAVHQGQTFVLVGAADETSPSDEKQKSNRNSLRPSHEQIRLSAREQEVLSKLAFGYTNQQIADSIKLSVKTVESYRARIAEKIGLRTRADYIRYGLETGLLKNTTYPHSP